jgi:hypothetical protein
VIKRIAFLVVAVMLAGCGGSTVTEGPMGPSPAATPAGSAAPSEMVVTRSGGIAGFNDTLHIAADGTAQITDSAGTAHGCRPDQAVLDRLRAIDLVAVGSAPPKAPIPDGFNYTVTTASGTASGGDGDNDGIRAEFVAAAAAVVTSCLENQSDAEQ